MTHKFTRFAFGTILCWGVTSQALCAANETIFKEMTDAVGITSTAKSLAELAKEVRASIELFRDTQSLSNWDYLPSASSALLYVSIFRADASTFIKGKVILLHERIASLRSKARDSLLVWKKELSSLPEAHLQRSALIAEYNQFLASIRTVENTNISRENELYGSARILFAHDEDFKKFIIF